jgi:nucleoid DNA-binding protein
MKKQRLTKDEFIHLLAEKCNYTIADTELFIDNFTELFRECVQNDVEFEIRHFGRLYITDVAERKGFKPVPGVPGAGQEMIYPPTKRVVFRVSGDVRDIVKIRSFDEEA